MRAPLSPPRLSLSRKFDADGQAVETPGAPARAAEHQHRARQLLQQQGPDLQTALDQTIEDYLPPRWLENATVLASASSITFRMLLDHTSGIGDLSMNGAPENLKDNPDYYHFSQPLGGTQGCVSYANENYRIMTYLIPALAEPNALLAVHTGSYQKSLDEYLDIMELAYGLSFENYMKK